MGVPLGGQKKVRKNFIENEVITRVLNELYTFPAVALNEKNQDRVKNKLKGALQKALDQGIDLKEVLKRARIIINSATPTPGGWNNSTNKASFNFKELLDSNLLQKGAQDYLNELKKEKVDSSKFNTTTSSQNILSNKKSKSKAINNIKSSLKYSKTTQAPTNITTKRSAAKTDTSKKNFVVKGRGIKTTDQIPQIVSIQSSDILKEEIERLGKIDDIQDVEQLTQAERLEGWEQVNLELIEFAAKLRKDTIASYKIPQPTIDKEIKEREKRQNILQKIRNKYNLKGTKLDNITTNTQLAKPSKLIVINNVDIVTSKDIQPKADKYMCEPWENQEVDSDYSSCESTSGSPYNTSSPSPITLERRETRQIKRSLSCPNLSTESVYHDSPSLINAPIIDANLFPDVTTPNDSSLTADIEDMQEDFEALYRLSDIISTEATVQQAAAGNSAPQPKAQEFIADTETPAAGSESQSLLKASERKIVPEETSNENESETTVNDLATQKEEARLLSSDKKKGAVQSEINNDLKAATKLLQNGPILKNDTPIQNLEATNKNSTSMIMHSNQIAEIVNYITLDRMLHQPILLSAAAAGDAVALIKRGIWVSRLYNQVKQSPFQNIIGYNVSNTGGSIGFDFQRERNVFGVSYSYVYSKSRFNNSILDTSSASNHILSIYGEQIIARNFSLGNIISFARNNIDKVTTQKHTSNLSGNKHSYGFLNEIALKYHFVAKNQISLVPHVGAKYAYSKAAIFTANNTQDINIKHKKYDDLMVVAGSKILFYPVPITKNMNIFPTIYGSIEKLVTTNKRTISNNNSYSPPAQVANPIILQKPKNYYNLGIRLGLKSKYIEAFTNYQIKFSKKCRSYGGFLSLICPL